MQQSEWENPQNLPPNTVCIGWTSETVRMRLHILLRLFCGHAIAAHEHKPGVTKYLASYLENARFMTRCLTFLRGWNRGSRQFYNATIRKQNYPSPLPIHGMYGADTVLSAGGAPVRGPARSAHSHIIFGASSTFDDQETSLSLRRQAQTACPY